MKTPRATLLALAGLLTAAAPAVAQEDPDEQDTQPPAAEAQDSLPQPPRTAELVFEREVFAYPGFQRRNPFIPLVDDEAGPRYEQIRLRGIIYSDEAGESVALLGLEGENPEADATNRSRRLRAGETWGNVRVLEIRRTDVLVQVEEFGLTEQRTMELPTRGQGA